MHLGPPIRPPSEPKPGDLAYRAYLLDGSGRITNSHEFHAADDGQAIRITDDWREGRKVELWQRTRIVKVWG